MENNACELQAGSPVGTGTNPPGKWKQSIFVVFLACLILTVELLTVLAGTLSTDGAEVSINTNIPEIYDMYLTDQLHTVLDGMIPVKRVYKLSDSDMAAPKPNAECYGVAEDPTELKALLEDASELLDGQETLFTTETKIMRGSKIHYYLDETILAITWKQVFNSCVYTFCEVKIAHATQFRRYLSGGKYSSGVLHTTTEMAESVNAVVAASGDYYGYRGIGLVVNNGLVYRDKGQNLDSCGIDENGDLVFVKRGQITDQEGAEKFVEENNIRFSLSFGPVMIENGEYCVPYNYVTGEINDEFAREALCQLDTLHYAVVTANYEGRYGQVPNVRTFTKNLMSMGIKTAYGLDGGQTATIVMNNKMMNTVSYGAQRNISDIIYFATAIPNEGD